LPFFFEPCASARRSRFPDTGGLARCDWFNNIFMNKAIELVTSNCNFGKPVQKYHCLIALLLSVGAAHAADIVIGQSTPLTGSNADIGKDIRDGAQAYFAKVNASGGVTGRMIKLVSLDDRNDPKLAAENAKQLIDQNALALFGYASSTLSLPSMAAVKEHRIPFIAPFTGADAIRKQNDYVFTIRATYTDELDKILSYWTNLGVNKSVVIHYEDEIGKQNFQTVARYLERFGKQPKSIAIKRNTDVAETTIKSIIEADPQFIVLTTLYGPGTQIIKALKAAGKFYPISSLSFVGASQLAKAAGKDAEGVSVALVVPSPKNGAVPVVRECREAWNKTGNAATMSPTSLEACIAAKVLVEGIRNAGKEPSRDSLKKGLEDLGRYDAGGLEIVFSPTSHHGGSFVDLAVITSNGDLRN
jgi:branched-chain amino acid transport system substrate-binding protein